KHLADLGRAEGVAEQDGIENGGRGRKGGHIVSLESFESFVSLNLSLPAIHDRTVGDADGARATLAAWHRPARQPEFAVLNKVDPNENSSRFYGIVVSQFVAPPAMPGLLWYDPSHLLAGT